jgi:hypothetical protein
MDSKMPPLPKPDLGSIVVGRDEVPLGHSGEAMLAYGAECRRLALEEAAQCIDKLALGHKIDSKAWTALRGNATAIRAMKGAV